MGVHTALSGLARLALAVLFVWSGTAAAADSSGRPTILATLFPQYDFARRIAGDRATVRLLLPPGVESHSYEPTPSDMKAIAGADLFIYTGDYMEPWARRLAASAAGPDGPVVVDASRGIDLLRDDAEDDHDQDSERDRDHDHDAPGEADSHEFNPHVWLDPILAMTMVETIADALAGRDPEYADAYRRNADALKADIAALDERFRQVVAAAPRRTLVFGERFAFAYFFKRYGLEKIGAYHSDSPGAEPGPRAVIEVVEYVRRNKVHYIYQEAMDQGRISKLISRETGAEILLVDSLHNLPTAAVEAGVTYLEIMRRNMDAFAKGLE